MKYFVDDEEVTEEKFRDVLEEEVRTYVERNLDDLIDDCTPEIHIGNLTFNPSYVLKKCDPIAYNCAEDDYVNMEFEDRLYNFEREYEDTINSVDFRTEEEEEQ